MLVPSLQRTEPRTMGCMAKRLVPTLRGPSLPSMRAMPKVSGYLGQGLPSSEVFGKRLGSYLLALVYWLQKPHAHCHILYFGHQKQLFQHGQKLLWPPPITSDGNGRPSMKIYGLDESPRANEGRPVPGQRDVTRIEPPLGLGAWDSPSIGLSNCLVWGRCHLLGHSWMHMPEPQSRASSRLATSLRAWAWWLSAESQELSSDPDHTAFLRFQVQFTKSMIWA